MSKLDTAPYKGVRDFYPKDQFIQNYIFGIWREVAESFGYSEMNASILEPSELYKEKSGEEIVNEQTFTFTDRGERKVTLRPEMTPTVARMIAARKRELGFPLRWYSIQNFFRYEAPQKGRLREHWQLNADAFGIENLETDIELISLANAIMYRFGAKDSDFVIKVNYGDNDAEKLGEIVGQLEIRGIKNIKIDPALARGQTYYTGAVFEIFDTNPENSRSLLGGGRYDDLMGLFDAEKIPAVGFGSGDVTIRDFLQTHGLLPEYKNSATLALLPIEKKYFDVAGKIANELRKKKVNVFIDWTDKKVGDKIKNADKQKISFIAVVGEDEMVNKQFKLKNLKTGEEREVTLDKIPECVR
ncbi:MAG: histidine--tRNA ligase [Patescibacteria group bacterium]